MQHTEILSLQILHFIYLLIYMGFTVDSGVDKIWQIVETVSTFISIMTLLHNLSVMNRFV